MKININVSSKQKFNQLTNATNMAVGSALYMVAEEIMTDSKTNYVPVVTGALRRSGFVNKPIITTNRVAVELGFGGSAISYALAVHERPNGFGQGKNKYLIKPIRTASPNIAPRMAVFIKKLYSSSASGI